MVPRFYARASYIDEYPRHQLSGLLIAENFNVDWVGRRKNFIIDTLQYLMNNKVDVQMPFQALAKTERTEGMTLMKA
jgi:hypothetical protein